MATATCGASLGVQIAGSAMAGTAGYCAENLVAGKSGSAAGMTTAAASGTTGAMIGVMANKAVSTISSKLSYVPKLQNGDIVYRVYGGDAKPNGASWTTTNPNSVKNYRNKAGLPSGKESGVMNTGKYMIEGTVIDNEKCVGSRKALSLDGNKGGLNEYIIPDAVKNGAIKINSVSDCDF